MPRLARFRKPPRLLAQLAVQRVANALDVGELDIPILFEDLADSHALGLRRAAELTADGAPPAGRSADGGPARVAWLAIPPAAGSGGHTTLFRMMRAAQEAGLRNTLLFYNRFHSPVEEYAEIVRAGWPWLDCEIAAAGPVVAGFDAAVASSWPTAHVLANRAAPGTRLLYFVQDFEPYFFPRGDIYEFAADTYRFGFRNIALGPMVQEALARELDVPSDLVPFGGDTSGYRLEEPVRPRRGVVFYAKPGNDRRGFRLAVLALQRFHEKHPDQPIHAYGDHVSGLGFPVVDHGRLTPERLAELYRSAAAGLSLSFTNISLVPEEMLACGTIPVLNDTGFARAVLDNPHVAWARPTPSALAAALSDAVTRHDPDVARAASRSVRARSWAESERAVVRVLADELGSEVKDGRVAVS